MAFHTFDINEVYSNDDGSIQYIELLEMSSADGQHVFGGHTLVSDGESLPLSNLSSSDTSNRSVLFATQGFADLGIVTPDFIIPSGFLALADGSVNFAEGTDTLLYSMFPATGALNGSGNPVAASPKNFAGATKVISGEIDAGTSGGDNLTGSAKNDFLAGLGGNDVLVGQGGKDTMNGGAGGDVLKGGGGSDQLTGSAGVDKFVFNSALNATGNKDTITDFLVGTDKIQLDDDIFTAFGSGGVRNLPAASFKVGSPTAADDFILYNKTTGVLSYDADGNGAGAAVAFAVLTGSPDTLSAASFQIIG